MMKTTKTVWIALISIALAAVPMGTLHAAMIPTSEAVSSLMRTENRAKVEHYLQRKDVRGQFEKLGVEPAEASLRVASMSDFELNKLAGQIDHAPAGADVVVISLTTVLVVIVILLLLRKI